MIPKATNDSDTHSQIDLLWQQYRDNHTPETREKLILFYAPMIRKVVSRMGLHPDGAMEWDDLINYGIFGLMDAVDRFEPERGITFETFASLRVRGAVLDALRQQDPLGRLARRRVSAAKEAIQQLSTKLGRVPGDGEVAEVIGLTEEQYRQVLQDSSFMILSLDQPAYDNEDGHAMNLAETLEDPGAASILDSVEEEETRERLAHALQKLSHREQVLLSLYYTEGLTMREVADVMEISQTRVCQIHSRAILTLKALMAAPKDPPKPAAPNRELLPGEETISQSMEDRLLQPTGRRRSGSRSAHWSSANLGPSSRFDSG